MQKSWFTIGKRQINERRGAVMPLFAFLLPVIFIMCGLAINVSYLRLVKTELKIATDASVHAGGRAISIHQTSQAAIDHAISTAALNSVGGCPFVLADETAVGFGLSTRGSNGYGRYSFSPIPRAQVDNGSHVPNSISVIGSRNVPLLFRGLPGTSSALINTASIATQVDRDFGLVLDRSGSMYWYKSQIEWDWVFNDMRSRGRISNTERNNARNAIWNTHAYSWNSYLTTRVYDRLFEDRDRDQRYLDVHEYVRDWRYSNIAPRHSRWAQLITGVNAFFDVLDATDQEELVSLATFSSGSALNYNLRLDYDPIRNFVGNVNPSGSTAIGRGIQTSIPSIMTAPGARPFAAKTIVVLTDGVNNVSPTPDDVAEDMVSKYNIVLHTVTFTNGADQEAMAEVARIGGGKHYHGDDDDQLVEIFEEIANNLPTILTQ